MKLEMRETEKKMAALWKICYKEVKRNVHTWNYKWLLVSYITFTYRVTDKQNESQNWESVMMIVECLVFISLQLERPIDFQVDFLYFIVILWEIVKEEMVSSTCYLMRIIYTIPELN